MLKYNHLTFIYAHMGDDKYMRGGYRQLLDSVFLPSVGDS